MKSFFFITMQLLLQSTLLLWEFWPASYLSDTCVLCDTVRETRQFSDRSMRRVFLTQTTVSWYASSTENVGWKWCTPLKWWILQISAHSASAIRADLTLPQQLNPSAQSMHWVGQWSLCFSVGGQLWYVVPPGTSTSDVLLHCLHPEK